MSIRIWFLIQQFVMRQNLPEYNHIPFVHYLHCCSCTTRVAIIQDYFPNLEILARVPAGLFTTAFSVQVAEDYRVIDGMTVADTYCIQCRNLLGPKIITVPQPSSSHTVGRFVMILNRLVCWNNVTLLDLLLEGNNEQAPNDQDGGADEEQDYDQNGGSNEQNADLDGNGGINEQVPNQDVDIVEGLGNIDLNANI
ncbi:uncharacterized protein LOC125807702 [Solanum verrucosum]|uniref:uncharacterized protein LOC125807702 n=1 Tax=Solanum verrucosum TaxID=315347 RepID=UPI0020D12C02|nr:uncharacterized protein LOC125807702 [Solanum verrucosum]